MVKPKVIDQKLQPTSSKLTPLKSRNFKETLASKDTLKKAVKTSQTPTTKDVGRLLRLTAKEKSKDEPLSQGKYVKRPDSDDDPQVLGDRHTKERITPKKKIKLYGRKENEYLGGETKENLQEPTPGPSKISGLSTSTDKEVSKASHKSLMKFRQSEMKLQFKKKADVSEFGTGQVMQKKQDSVKESDQYPSGEISKMLVTQDKNNKVVANEKNKIMKHPPKVVTKDYHKEQATGVWKKFAVAAAAAGAPKKKQLSGRSLTIDKPTRKSLSCSKAYLKQMGTGQVMQKKQDSVKESDQYPSGEISKMLVTQDKNNKVVANEKNKIMKHPPKVVTKDYHKEQATGVWKKFAVAAAAAAGAPKKKQLSGRSLTIDKPTRKSLSCPKAYLKQMVSGSKPNWQKIKRLSGELKTERKKRKMTNYEKVLQAKKLWEEGRKEDCASERREKLVVSMYNLVSENLEKCVYAHDTSRMIQWIIKQSTPMMQSCIFDALKPALLSMIQNKFSCYVIKALLKCSNKSYVTNIVQMLQGNIVKLMCNSVASPLIEYIYSTHATSQQKRLMEMEFFNRIVKIISDEDTVDLGSILAQTTEKNTILEQIKDTIIKIIDRGQVSSSLLHTVAMEYLDFANENQKNEILTSFYPHIMSLVETKAGARISMHCCWYLPRKAKKTIIKSLKGKVRDICLSEEGYWLLLALLDSVDDTVLLKKIIISELLENILSIVKHEKGRKVLLYLVCHRDTAYFHPKDIKVLSTADTCGSMLKPLSARRSEILSPVMESLLECVSSYINQWFEDPSTAMVLLAILKVGEGAALRGALKATAQFVTLDIQVMEKGREMPLIEHTGFNHVLKKLVKLDEAKEHTRDMFSFYLMSALNPITIRKWIECNRGCFLLASVLETRKTKIISMVKEKIDDDLLKEIHQKVSTGAKLLYILLQSKDNVEDL